jgi:hypothetical protein
LRPSEWGETSGTFSWTTDLGEARRNAESYYPETEGVDVTGSTMLFVCKGVKHLFTLDLDKQTYTRQSTQGGLFEGEPDQLRTILPDDPDGETLLFFTEDDGWVAGVHARNSKGELLSIVEGPGYSPETTGIARK